MTHTGYLRTNWRNTKQVLALNAVGNGITQGSAFGGAGAYPNGGLIFLRVSAFGSTAVGAQAAYSIPAESVLASVFGVNGFGGPGYKILPIAIFPQFMSATAGGATSVLNMVASITTSDDSTIRFYVQIASLTNDNKASYFSAIWHWAGFIVSTP